jgi:hypothetical protein
LRELGKRRPFRFTDAQNLQRGHQAVAGFGYKLVTAR